MNSSLWAIENNLFPFCKRMKKLIQKCCVSLRYRLRRNSIVLVLLIMLYYKMASKNLVTLNMGELTEDWNTIQVTGENNLIKHINKTEFII